MGRMTRSWGFLRWVIGGSLMLLSLVGCGSRGAAPVQRGQHAYVFERGGQRRLNYLLFVPEDYGKGPRKKWPLILFLHGIGERGDGPEELELLKEAGLPMVLEQQADFPFIVLSPQCPTDSYWEFQLDDMDALLDEVTATYAVDPDRVYVTGLSMGGFGTWALALRYPNRFAALVPIAGGYMFESDAIPERICDLKDVPVWVFHGAQDTVVLPRQSEVMVSALRACGGDVRFTLYPDAEHDSWTETYGNPELYAWLLERGR
jgi:predicted peptidase